MSELISVIIPTYEHAKSLGACLDSVLTQTYPNVEVIVVDDGSTDNTQEVLKSYNARVQIIRQENMGPQKARMSGFEASKGIYVIFCDADVVMKTDMLEALYDALQDHPEASYAYGGFKFGWKSFRPVPFDANRLKQHNYVHTTSLVRRKDFPGFDPAIKRLQDWDVWLTMLGQGKTGTVVSEELFVAHIDGASRIGTSWMPSWVYSLPWSVIGWKPKQLRKYESAKAVLEKKHGL